LEALSLRGRLGHWGTCKKALGAKIFYNLLQKGNLRDIIGTERLVWQVFERLPAGSFS